MIGSRLPDKVPSMMQNLSSWHGSASDAEVDTQTRHLHDTCLGPFNHSALQLPGNLSIPTARIPGRQIFGDGHDQWPGDTGLLHLDVASLLARATISELLENTNQLLPGKRS